MRTKANWRRGASAPVALALALVAIAALAGSGGASGQTRSAPVNQVRPKITGDARVGSTLSRDVGTWSGTNPISFSVVWRRCGPDGGNCVDIPGTTNWVQYKVASADTGRTLRIFVLAKNRDGEGTQTSPPTAVVRVAGSAPENQVRPKITGEAREGNTLSSDVGAWSGTKPISFTLVWRRCGQNGGNCADIPGTTNEAQYKVVSADIGKTLRILVTAKNEDGQGTQTSPPTAVVKPAKAQSPKNTVAPSISGTAQEGQTLAANRGQWDGSEPISFTVNWQRCDQAGSSCANIIGATSLQYVLTSADVANRIRLRVIAANAVGRTTAYSLPTGVVAAKGPALPPGAIRLPDGKISIPASSVSPPERLVIAQLAFSPNPLRSRADTITARFRIFDTRGYVVRDALVFVVPLPYGWTTQPGETTAGTDGWAEVQMRATARLPRRGAVVMFVRARKAGDNVLTGVSTRRLVQMLVNIS